MSLIQVNSTPVLAADELDTLRRTIGHDLDPNEFELFAAICRRTGLDPFARQIYAVKRWDARQKREVMQIQTGIDGLRLIAERSRNYAGQTPTEWCGQDGKWVDVWLSPEAPAAARVGVLRHDFKEPVYGVAKFSSYCATTKAGEPMAMWRTMPEVMIAKCAEALAIRKAFPNDVSGVYTREEMAQQHNVDGPPLATPEQVDKIDSLLPVVPDAAMPELKAWKAEQGITMKAGEFTAEMADDVIAKLEQLVVDVPPVDVIEVQEPVAEAPPLPAEVRTGGEGSGHRQEPVASTAVHGIGVEAPLAPTPSGVSPEPGGESPATTPPPLDVAAVEQTAAGTAAPAGPDTPEWFAGANRKARAIAKSALGPDSKDPEYVARWEALVWAASGGTTTESKALTQEQHQAFVQRLKDVSQGKARIVESSDPAFLGYSLEYREAQ